MQAEEEFDQYFYIEKHSERHRNDETSAFGTVLNIGTLITEVRLAASKSEVRRLSNREA